ncbi:MAG: response regulator transcription factor [Fimbriimonas ginsengisoli]|uniref:Response regulator transcription factor n=1 Tax=Fimbriimonas ginsengisoli TaxID=1005039 RepID=A0A931LUG8_FIMGI|nr:response regulator transcription factor [Fimbriimonas ginsengisoli]
MKLLIIDDEPTIVDAIEGKLRREGYSTFTAGTAEDGMRLFRKLRPDLVILDIMLPSRSGFDFCRAVRENNRTPIIMISARSEDKDRIQGLELGADDYVVKPFNLAELSARVRAVLRRAGADAPGEPIESGDLVIDPRSHQALHKGEPMDLSPKEFALLQFLALNPGQAFSRQALLDRVWGQDAYVSERTVDVHVHWLRSRIELDPAHPKRIVTVRGVGYRFVS